jgi:hypothetical protein
MEFKEDIYKPITYIHNHKPHICLFGNDKQETTREIASKRNFMDENYCRIIRQSTAVVE